MRDDAEEGSEMSNDTTGTILDYILGGDEFACPQPLLHGHDLGFLKSDEELLDLTEPNIEKA